VGIIIRQSAWITAINYLGIVLGFLNVLYFYPLFFTPELVGLTGVLYEAALTLSIFSQFGLQAGIVRFFPFFKNPEKQHHGFATWMMLLNLGGFILLSGLFGLVQPQIVSFYSAKSPLFIDYLYFLLPLTFFVTFGNTFEQYAASNQQAVYPRLVREILTRVLLCVLIFAYFIFGFDTHTLLLFFVGIYGVSFLINFLHILHIEGYHLRLDTRFVSRAFAWEIFRYLLLLGITGALGNIFFRVDIFIIGVEFGLADVGVYRLAFFMATVIEIPYKAIVFIAAPLVSGFIKEGKWTQVNEIYQKSSVNQFLLSGFIFLGIWCNIHNVYQLIPNSELYKAGMYVVLFIGLGKLIDSLSGINTVISANSNLYPYFLPIGLMLILMNVGLCYTLIPHFGIVGVAMSVAVSMLVFNLTHFLLLYFNYRLNPFSPQTLYVLFIFLLTWGLVSLLPFLGNTYLDLALRSICLTIVYWLCVLRLGISTDINGLIKKISPKIPVAWIRRVVEWMVKASPPAPLQRRGE
jgi:O-antigen/teichoic acid export membrane protein